MTRYHATSLTKYDAVGDESTTSGESSPEGADLGLELRDASGSSREHGSQQLISKEENTIPTSHIIPFILAVAFFWSLVQGGYGQVNFEFTELLGVTIFFQTLTTLIVGPATGYSALAFGYLSDRVESHRFGRRKPVLLPLMFLSCSGLFMFFTPPNVHQHISMPAWFFASIALYQIPYTGYSVVAQAWAYEMSRSSTERGKLFAGVTVATILGTALGTCVSVSTHEGIRKVAICMSVMIIISNLYLVWAVPHQPLAEAPVREPIIPAIRSCIKNRPFRVLFSVIAMLGFCASLPAKIQSFFLQQIFQVRYKTVQSATLGGTVVMVLGVSIANAITPKLITRFGLKRIMIFALVLMGSGQILWFFTSFWVNIYAFMALNSTTLGFGLGMALLTGEIMIGATIDYDTLLTGKRRESMYSGVRMLPNIFLDNIAAAIGLGLLGALGFKSETNPFTGIIVENSEACVMYLRIMSTLVPAAGLFLAAYIMRYYDLDLEAHNRILDQIHRREAGEVFEIVDPIAPVGHLLVSPVTSSSSPSDEPHGFVSMTTEAFTTKDEEATTELFYMYFSQQELWLLTETAGIKTVLTHYMIDLILIFAYLMTLTISGFRALVVAVRDAGAKTNAPDTRRAQYAAQFIVAMAMCLSLLFLFQVGRWKGMRGIKNAYPDTIAWQAAHFLRKGRGGGDRPTSYQSVYSKATRRRLFLHSLGFILVLCGASYVNTLH